MDFAAGEPVHLLMAHARHARREYFRRFQKSAAMKAILLVTALFLSACTSTGTVTPQSVVDWLSTNCGVIVNAADVAGLISKDPTAITTADLGKQICDAIHSGPPTASPGASGVVVVNGVPIHYRTK